jgi:hypothetical protein
MVVVRPVRSTGWSGQLRLDAGAVSTALVRLVADLDRCPGCRQSATTVAMRPDVEIVSDSASEDTEAVSALSTRVVGRVRDDRCP